MITLETVSCNSQHTFTSCLLRKAPLGLPRISALSVTGRVVTTADWDYPHILVYFTTYSVVSCRQRIAKEATKISIMFENLFEKIKNLWYTRILGY